MTNRGVSQERVNNIRLLLEECLQFRAVFSSLTASYIYDVNYHISSVSRSHDIAT